VPREVYYKLGPIRNFHLRDQDRYVGYAEYMQALEDICKSHTLRSIVWMFIRTVPESKETDELDEVRFETFKSEFYASQNTFSESQIVNWPYYLYPGKFDVANPYTQHVRRLLPRFKWFLRRSKDLYPKLQRRKNVSQHTAILYKQRYPSADLYQVSTKDLEVHYYNTGEQLDGDCEMRQAWKFNDLKPRFYYCQGGRDYFKSRYMKQITVYLMDSLRTTQTTRRQDPSTELEVRPTDNITFWDYTAFTTSLSELKFFLYWIARGVEELGEVLTVIDYNLGKVQMDPSDLIHSYNETINMRSPFSIHRIVDRFLYDFEQTSFRQENSGMLGVAGNIGCSTICHGAVIATVVGEDRSVCIGDDGAAVDDDDPYDSLIPTIRSIGSINDSKFQIIWEGDEGPVKFVKRGTYRDVSSLFIDFLHSLPISVFVDGVYDPRRTLPPDFTVFNRYKKVLQSIQTVLWTLADNYERAIDDQDYLLLLQFLRSIYSHLGLPFEGGALIPDRVRKDKDRPSVIFPFIVPSLNHHRIDHRKRDWLEYFFDTRPQGLVIPEYVSFYKIPIPSQGQEVVLPDTREMKLLEDIGVCRIVKNVVVLTSWKEENRRLMRLFLKREISKSLRQAITVTFFQSIPSQFCFMFDPPAEIDYMRLYDGNDF
jgi:hypothetical protein